ncbi:MAG TPA: tetratricopeptide repeat protein [Opitutaceae bacterium]|nr:tetratricopeptide repeat protein [Opitutaceae bacterium]
MAAITALAYGNSLHGPFVFDGEVAIVHNPTLRSLAAALRPPADGSPVTGRPLVNLSFAFNYAWGGLDSIGYHLVNLGLHVTAALTLFGIVARTVRRLAGAGHEEVKAHPTAFAALCALLWAVHPLTTEAVTYVAQRAEALMGLLYLLTLYGFIRGTEAAAGAGRRAWYAVAVAACAAGMAAKEVMVTAPLAVWLYDRTFVAGSWRQALRERRRFYGALAAGWAILAGLAAAAGTRGGTIGFHTPIPWTRYAAEQTWAVAHYLRLSLWPHPLILDYGSRAPVSAGALAADGALVAGLAAVTVAAVIGRRALGFLGAAFFGILAPTSSIIPIATEIAAEHRMYLPLAAVVVAVAAGARRALRAWSWPVLAVAVAAPAAVTVRRNADYRSAVSLWTAETQAAPASAGAHNNLGAALLAAGRMPAAADEFAAAVRLDPALAGAHNNLGQIWLREGRFAPAIGEFAAALRLAPAYPQPRQGLAAAEYGLGHAWALQQNWAEAIPAYEAALAADPALVGARVDLGSALLESGRPAEAIAAYREALRLRPDYAVAHHDLAAALHAVGRDDEARRELAAAAELKGEP